jgi:hypothetical protein
MRTQAVSRGVKDMSQNSRVKYREGLLAPGQGSMRTMVCVLFVCLFACSSTFGQSQELQQLKERVRQLEQIAHELKAQIEAIEQGQKGQESPAKVQAPSPGERHTGLATRQRETAAQNETTAARINNEEISAPLQGFIRFPGTQTLFRPGGFVKTDFFYDLNYAGSYYGAYVPSSFPSAPQPKTANSTVSMRPSRFNVEFRQPSVYGSDVKAYLELDFLGNYDRNSLRLRHFYAQWRNVLIGQYWSAFGDPDAFPDTLEFEGPPGIMGVRQPQMRYTIPVSKRHSLGVSVEKSGTDAPFSTQFGAPVGVSNRPDLLGFYRYENNFGHLHAAFVSRSVGGFIPNTPDPELRAEVNGYGTSLSGAWKLGSDTRDNVVFQGIFGKGISNYYNDNFGLGSDVGGAADGHLVATPTGSFEVGYQHYWTGLLRSTVSYGYLRINNTARDPGTNYHISNYATANLIYQPTPSFLFGAEYIYGSLERKDGFKWSAPRIQVSATYYINKYPRAEE